MTTYHQKNLWLWLMQTMALPKAMYPSWDELQPLLAIHAVNIERRALPHLSESLHETLQTLVRYAKTAEYQYVPNKPDSFKQYPQKECGTLNDHDWAQAMVISDSLILSRYLPEAWRHSWNMGIELLLDKDTIVSSMTNYNQVSLDLIP